MNERGADPVSCVSCGETRPAPPPTWTMDRSGSRERWYCEECTRRNVRDIEGRLDIPF